MEKSVIKSIILLMLEFSIFVKFIENSIHLCYAEPYHK